MAANTMPAPRVPVRRASVAPACVAGKGTPTSRRGLAHGRIPADPRPAVVLHATAWAGVRRQLRLVVVVSGIHERRAGLDRRPESVRVPAARPRARQVSRRGAALTGGCVPGKGPRRVPSQEARQRAATNVARLAMTTTTAQTPASWPSQASGHQIESMQPVHLCSQLKQLSQGYLRTWHWWPCPSCERRTCVAFGRRARRFVPFASTRGCGGCFASPPGSYSRRTHSLMVPLRLVVEATTRRLTTT